MSGGSFNYLCWATDLEDLLSKRSSLTEMADALAEKDYARDAAQETEALRRDLTAFSVRIEVAVKRLSDVWHAVEWWYSGDGNEDDLHEALAKYRGES